MVEKAIGRAKMQKNHVKGLGLAFEIQDRSCAKLRVCEELLQKIWWAIGM